MYKNVKIKNKKIILGAWTMLFTFLFSIVLSNVNAVSYVYNLKSGAGKEAVSQESSVSTIATPEFTFESTSQVLMEPTTGKILYANNENEHLYPASVTKIMTLLLIMEQIDSGKMAYTDKISCSANASGMGGSQIWFREGEELTVEDCLKAICVVSANDVSVAMAEHIGGSEENFVKMMNDKAKVLGMENSSFKNSHGIDEEGHYTSALDIAIMSRELITKHPDVLKYTSIWMDTLRDGTFALSSTNKLIRFYEGATGLKTGSTSQALFNLSATATRNDTTYISVIMRAPSSAIRLEETKQLLNYGFATYEVQSICDRGTIIETKQINKNVSDEIQIKVKDDVASLIEKGGKIDFEQKIVYNEEISAPLKANDVIGTIEILDKTTGDVIGSSDLIIEKDIEKSNFIDYFKKVLNMFILNTNI